jgi:hypothetical protein
VGPVGSPCGRSKFPQPSPSEICRTGQMVEGVGGARR